MVQRYSTYGLDWQCETYPHDEGELVSYEDYQKLEAELEALRQQVKPPVDDGWIAWGGGERPAPKGTLVDIHLRDGGKHFGCHVEEWEWGHEYHKVIDPIIAYRVIRVVGN